MVLSVISNQKINEYTKELGIPVEVVMKWTGHSDYKAMKPYID